MTFSHKEKVVIAILISTALLISILMVIMYQRKILSYYQSRSKTLASERKKLAGEILSLRQQVKTQTTFLNGQNSKADTVNHLINQYSKKINGKTSIYFKNLTTMEKIVFEGDRKYYMASLYKVILTLYLLDEVKIGTLSLGDPVGTGSATLSQAINKIITESNNEYAQFIAEKYGWIKIERTMKSKYGINFRFNKTLETDVVNMGVLFEDIALSLNIKDNESSFLLSLLKNQINTSKLPKYLPKHIYSHNKTGEFEAYSHDAAIFYTPKANYILIFMSQTDDPASTNEQMALMSKEIYEVLNDSTTNN